MTMKRSVLFWAVGTMAVIVADAAMAAEKTKSEQAFDHLASLQGQWEGEEQGSKFNVVYTLTANGSALMEEFRPYSGPAMITMFTVDGDHLIATHYCSAR